MFREDRNVLDIWRRSADCFNPSTYLPCSPSHQQIQASPEHVPSFPPNYPPLERSTGRPFPSVDPTDDHGEPGAREGVPRRGAYLPFTQLEYNESVHKVRVCYPYMAVSVHSANGSHFHQIDVWEIPPMARRRTVRLEPPAWEGGLRTLSDMEQYVVDLAVGDGHLYVCWNTCIALYAWGTAENPNELGHEVHVDPIWRFSILELHAGNVPCFLYQLPDDSGGNDDTSQLEQHIQVTAVVAEARDPNQVRESLFPMGPSDMVSTTTSEIAKKTVVKHDKSSYRILSMNSEHARAPEEWISLQSLSMVGSCTFPTLFPPQACLHGLHIFDFIPVSPASLRVRR